MNRRQFLAATAATLATGSAGSAGAAAQPMIAGSIPAGHPLQAAWSAWKTVCLAEDGRVIDARQQFASHSEGQGYGLILAAIFGDDDSFDLIHGWTEQNLAIRPDALLAWRWRPDTRPHVPDRNNASDGDLFHAWALTSHGRRKGRADLVSRGVSIARALAQGCIVPQPGSGDTLLFLPARKGFEVSGGYVINPSYVMPRAMREVAEITGITELRQAAESGVALIDTIARSGLVPDWVEITAAGWALPPSRFSANAGYEAMRVPLFAAWSGQPDSPAIARYVAALRAAPDLRGTVTVFDRTSGAALQTSTDPGYQALGALLDCAASGGVGAAIPPFSTSQPYYPATLQLMSLVAQAQVYPKCIPL